jgi:protein tyrosine/serine phosphatase
MAQGGERSVIELIISARQVYLETALDEVGQRYWTLEGYLRDGLGLERDVLDALRSAFLEAA